MGTSNTSSPDANELDSTTYNAFIADLEVAGIELVKVHAERTAAGIATQTRFDLAATYMQGESVIYYRYEAIAHFVDEYETVLGNVAASIQLIVRSDVTVNEASIVQFGATSGTLMAHPYLREAVASMAQRI